MKRNKVLLGLFAGVLALMGGSAQAQQNKFFELGPSNIGGQVSCLAVDQQDLDHTTLFAGATTGGMYLRTDNEQTLYSFYQSASRSGLTDAQKSVLYGRTESWHYVPYINEDGREVVLPISAMLQCPSPSRKMLVGTGSNTYTVGSNFSRMSLAGSGIYLFDIDSYSFELINSTKNKAEFAAVRAMDYLEVDGTMYLYVATSTGLYRWTISQESDWNRSYETVFTGNVDQLVVAPQLKMAFFSSGSNLYKISNATGEITASHPLYLNITATNSAFGVNGGTMKLGMGVDPSYLYVMTVLPSGMMGDVYLSRDMQTWTALATSSVTPFSTNSGFDCGTICVDPGNPSHIYVAGSTVYEGTGYSTGALYQWMPASMSEYQLNAGDYMQYVFSSAYFLHSGIHQILPVYRHGALTYYVATNGGVFSTNQFSFFENTSLGMNNAQINGLAICPDGSVLSGANDNACPFIQSRTTHDGGTPDISWYDNGSNGNINHNANIIWRGTGGRVAASRFQQLMPNQRRNIYVSGESADYARSFKNYYDYTDNQVWTIGSAFLSSTPIGGGPNIGQIITWENHDDNIFIDSLNVHIDTNGYVLRGDSVVPFGGSSFVCQPGDRLVVLSRANSDYPFEYTFTQEHPITQPLRIKNKIQSRVAIIAIDSNTTNKWGVYYSWRASDFTKIYEASALDPAELEYRIEGVNLWPKIFAVNSSTERMVPRTLAMSEDGRFIYVALMNLDNGNSMLVRIGGFETVNFNQRVDSVERDLRNIQDNGNTKLHYDTLKYNNSKWLPRSISSMSVTGDSLVLTFDYNTPAFSNVAVVTNIGGTYMLLHEVQSSFEQQPAYSAIIEKTTGNLYVGADDGVHVYDVNAHTWSVYENVPSVPVTAIAQQTCNLPVRRHYTYDGVDTVRYLFAKTKWPNAIYFGTYGRGIFVDMTYVTDTVNEVSDPEDYLGIPRVASTEMSSVSIYPNPVWGEANLSLTTAVAGQARLRIYDLNGRCVVDSNLGYAAEGEQTYKVSTQGMTKGMYLVNVIVGGQTAATKMMVR